MMNRKSGVVLCTVIALSLALLTGCGGKNGLSDMGGGSSGVSGNSSSNSSGGASTLSAAKIVLLTSKPQLPSQNQTLNDGVTITAIAKNKNNAVVKGVPITFQADSGLLGTGKTTTDASGQAITTLATGRNQANRDIHVKAKNTNSGESQQIEIPVRGTHLQINGPKQLPINVQSTYTISLLDSAGKPITGEPVSVKSKRGNTLSASSLATDKNGNAKVELTPTQNKKDTLTVTGLGTQAKQGITVSPFTLSFPQKQKNEQIRLNQSSNLPVRLTKNGNPVDKQKIDFNISRGQITGSATTNSEGIAIVQVRSDSAGRSTVTANYKANLSAELPVVFIATQPATVDVQADPATISTQSQSTITAVVRNANDNLVKGQKVFFNVNGTTKGSLSVASSTTDDLGRATTVYNSTATSSGQDGITITATVRTPSSSFKNSTTLTVGSQALNIALGTGNKITVPDDVRYKQPYIAIVTDSAGNPVANKKLTLNVLSTGYVKGEYNKGAKEYTRSASVTCPSEDGLLADQFKRYNGILDQGEDANNNQKLDPGNVASVPKTVTTGSDGTATFNLTYPQSDANWVTVRLRATAKVAGTENNQTTIQNASTENNYTAIKNASFTLPIAKKATKVGNGPPPGQPSPFGQSMHCTDTQ